LAEFVENWDTDQTNLGQATTVGIPYKTVIHGVFATSDLPSFEGVLVHPSTENISAT
jgi:hypothetical protein